MVEKKQEKKKKSKLKELAAKTAEATRKAVEEAKKFASEKAVPALKKAGEEIKDFAENTVVPTIKETTVGTLKDVGSLTQEISKKKEEILSEDKMQELLLTFYDKSINGTANFSNSVEELAIEYLQNNSDVDSAVKALITDAVLKCENSDYMANYGRLVTMIAALPVSMYVQLRMCSAIALIGGFDIKSNNTQIMIFACLTGETMSNLVKNSGINLDQKFTVEMLENIPNDLMAKLAKSVLYKIMSKASTKGIVSVPRNIYLTPGAGSGNIDVSNTKAAGRNAYLVFIKNEMPTEVEGNIRQANIAKARADIDKYLEKEKQEKLTEKVNEETIEERIKKVNYLRDQGLIDEEDYKEKIRELLSKI